MIPLTDEQHRAIEDAGGAPVRVEDSKTKATYVLVESDVYDRIRPLLGDEMTPAEMAPLMWEVMKGDWDDPAMDVYDTIASIPRVDPA